MLAMGAAIKAKVNHYLQKVIKYFSKSKAVVTVKPRKKYTKGRGKTIKQTLSNLDKNFKELSRATGKASWDNRANTNALKKLGVFVAPNPMTVADLLKNQVELPEKFPGIMFVATNMFFPTDEGKAFPNFFYAVKHESSPYYVEPTKGVVYKIGLSVPLCAKTTKEKGNEKNFWVYFYIAIDPDGAVKTLRWLSNKQESVPHKNGKRTVFNRKTWQHPDLFAGDEALTTETDKETAHVGIFCACFNFWNNRDKMWTVQTKKKDLRMNFCVDTRDTKHYFKDREYAATLSGNRKKIIHFVDISQWQYNAFCF